MLSLNRYPENWHENIFPPYHLKSHLLDQFSGTVFQDAIFHQFEIIIVLVYLKHLR